MAELLQDAKRPVLVVGHLARWSLDLEALQALSTRLEAPICPTGLTPGFAGDALDTLTLDQVHEVLARADAVLMIGAALDWPLRQGVAIVPATPVLELRDTTDVAPTARAPDHLALGDLTGMVQRLTEALPPRNTPPAPPRPTPAPPVVGQAERLPPSFQLSAQVLEALSRDFPPRAALVVEGSTRLIQLARDIRPDQPWARFTPGLSGHLGCGPGQVLGAMASGRFDQVILVAGDFSLGLALGDIETLVRLNLPVKILVANNSGMGSGRAPVAGRAPDLVNYSPDTDYAQVMRGFGGVGHSLRDMADWPALARRVFDDPTPCLVDIREQV
jgi:thiamine pyrophosphate-dependent acetolactate synthase large subunit-like protein